MEAIIPAEYSWLWSVALGVVLFYPVRQLIWVLAVRRAQLKIGELPDEETRDTLKRSAGFTSALVCLIFAAVFGDLIAGGPQ